MATKKAVEYWIVNRRSKMALQPAGLENGSIVEQVTFNKSDDQVWVKVTVGDKIKWIHKTSSKVLDCASSGTENGTRIHIWDDVEAPSQFWSLSTGTYRNMLNVHSNRVLDIVNMSDEVHTPVQVWDDVGGENQQWKLVLVHSKAKNKTALKETLDKANQEETKPAKSASGKSTASKSAAGKRKSVTGKKMPATKSSAKLKAVEKAAGKKAAKSSKKAEPDEA